MFRLPGIVSLLQKERASKDENLTHDDVVTIGSQLWKYRTSVQLTRAVLLVCAFFALVTDDALLDAISGTGSDLDKNYIDESDYTDPDEDAKVDVEQGSSSFDVSPTNSTSHPSHRPSAKEGIFSALSTLVTKIKPPFDKKKSLPVSDPSVLPTVSIR